MVACAETLIAERKGKKLCARCELYLENCGCRYDAETENYYVRNRHYSPGHGQWLIRDPIGYQGGINLYGYVNSSPVGNVDAEGLAHAGRGGKVKRGRHDGQYGPPEKKKLMPGWQQRGNACKDAQEARNERRNKGRTPHYISKRPPVPLPGVPPLIDVPPPVGIPPVVPGAGAAGDLAVGGGGVLDLAVFGDVTLGEVLVGIGIVVL